MNDVFDKLTQRAHTAITLAREEAKRLNHKHIDSQHLLLGIVRERDGVAAQALANLGISLVEARRSVEEITGRGHRMILGELEFTPQAMRIIQRGVDEAWQMNHRFVGTEHLLLGIVREGDSIAANALERLGINLETVRSMTIQMMGQSAFQSATRPSSSRSRRRDEVAPAPRPKLHMSGITADAQHALDLAEVEAHHLHRDYVGDEHLLLGLILEGRSRAALALGRHGATIVAVRLALESIMTNRPDAVPPVYGIHERALDEAVRRGSTAIGPDHLLLGMLGLDDSVGVAVLRQLGIDPVGLCAEISQGMLGNARTDQPPE